MGVSIKYPAIIVGLIIFAAGCSESKTGNNNQLPGDVVENPISAVGNSSTEGLPVIKFAKTEHDFGKVIEGEKITYAFKFSNIGKSALLISKVSASCGCTVADYPREPVLPGKEGFINVTFDSENRYGLQQKTITVISNTQPNIVELTIIANIIVPGQ